MFKLTAAFIDHLNNICLYSDCVPKHFTDRPADHEIRAVVHRCHGFIDEDQLMSPVIIDEPRCRIYRDGRSADDQHIRIRYIFHGFFDGLLIQTFLIEDYIRLDRRRRYISGLP